MAKSPPNPAILRRTGDLTNLVVQRQMWDTLEKIQLGIQEGQQAAQSAASSPSPVAVTSGQTTIAATPKAQRWFAGDLLLDPDVTDVHVLPTLWAQRRAPGVIAFGNRVLSRANFVPASSGGWTTLNEVMPIPLWASGLQKLRLELRFNYIKGSRSTVCRISPNPTNIDGSDFMLEACSNGTTTDQTTWCLKRGAVGSGNVVKFQAPPAGIPVVLVIEFDGTNAGTGKAQWLVGMDVGAGMTPVALTNVTANNVGVIPQAFRFTWGSNYGDPTFGTGSTGSFPALPFSGVIAERRCFIGTSGSIFKEPPYTTCVGDWRVQNMVQATYVDISTIQMTQSHSGQPLGGRGYIYACTGNSIVGLYPCVAPNLGGLVEITIPIGGLAHGFPGTLNIQTTPISQPVPTWNVQVTVTTPNVARIKNLAFPNDDRYDLFNIPFGNSNPLFYPPPITSPVHNLLGVTNPEFFIGPLQ